MDHQIRSFKAAEYIYHEWINKQELLKLRNLYIVCGSPKKRFEIKVTESIHRVWITKEEVLKLRSLYIMCGSPKKKFLSCGVFIS